MSPGKSQSHGVSIYLPMKLDLSTSQDHSEDKMR